MIEWKGRGRSKENEELDKVKKKYAKKKRKKERQKEYNNEKNYKSKKKKKILQKENKYILETTSTLKLLTGKYQ